MPDMRYDYASYEWHFQPENRVPPRRSLPRTNDEFWLILALGLAAIAILLLTHPDGGLAACRVAAQC